MRQIMPMVRAGWGSLKRATDTDAERVSTATAISGIKVTPMPALTICTSVDRELASSAWRRSERAASSRGEGPDAVGKVERVGRTIATVAEICFAAQWVLVLHRLGTTTGADITLNVAWVILPLIIIAECFSWYAVLTTNYLGNTIENSIWAVAFFVIGIGLCRLLHSRRRTTGRRLTRGIPTV